MRIVFLDFLTLGDVDISLFERLGEVAVYDKTAPDERGERVKDAEIIITNKVVIDREVMAEAPELKLICVAATGVNNIDLEAAKERGVAVTNVAGYSTESVVAHTFAAYFHLAHHTPYYDRFGKEEWAKSDLFTHHALPFFNLAGKSWGIIGLGSIGKRVAQVATAFGCSVQYYSTSGQNRDPEIKRVALDELLASSDIVSIHAPLNSKTKGLITSRELATMKASAILLNLGRGGIVDESDLAMALDKGQIRAAGLDVLEKEPPEAANKLFEIKKSYNLFLSPHIAWASVEARDTLIKEIYENITSFQDGIGRNQIV